MKHPDFELVMLVTSATVGIANLFVFCYFGKLTTESFVNMADCVYHLKWQKFDIKLKKSLIPIIQSAQQPLYYEGYGIFTLNLQMFTQVIHKLTLIIESPDDFSIFLFIFQFIKTIFSYYMFLKTFTH